MPWLQFIEVLALDIETEPRPEFAHIEDAALIPHMARITCVGISGGKYYPESYFDFKGDPNAPRELSAALQTLRQRKIGLCGHNFKFDLKHLAEAGIEIDPWNWVDDTELMARVLIDKVPEDYLAAYEERRKEENKKLGRTGSHRKGGAHSLKVLAPYFLGVEPFWENPTDHHSKEYVLKDCRYTAQLRDLFEERLRELGHFEFYRTKQLPWTKTLYKAERQGILLDVEKLVQKQAQSEQLAGEYLKKLREQWATEIAQYRQQKEAALTSEYLAMEAAAVAKLKDPSPEKAAKTIARYGELLIKALETLDGTFNFDSPTQLSWLLKEALGLDIRDFEGEEGTGKEVLQKLTLEGNDDVKLLLDYRREKKLSTAFFPSYLELKTPKNRIHTNINPFAKTGRTTSSNPNLQQVPGHLHDLFIADPGHLFITRDVGALEPTLIAYFSADPALMEILQKGLSFHSINAQEIFKLPCEVDEVAEKFPNHRSAAKEFGLSVLYGAGGKRVQQSLKKRGFDFSLEDCKVFVQRLREKYAGVWDFKQRLDSVLEAGDVIYNYMGRPIHFADSDEVYMRGFNRLIQGSGSDIVLDAMSRVPGAVLFVHDEIVVSAPEAAAEARAIQIQEVFDSYKLENELGRVRLTLEGKIAKYWSK
jgi:DNA polymerase I-like protein with 3'-5' exonuclease and polymerase domains